MNNIIKQKGYLEIPLVYLDFIKDLKELGIETYVTGGAVRDHLLNFDYTDFDLFCKCEKENFLSKVEVDVIVDFDNVLILEYKGNVFTISLSASFENSFNDRDYTVNSLWYCPLKCEIFGYKVSFEDISRHLLRPCREENLNTITIMRALRFWDKYGLSPYCFSIYNLKLDTIDTTFKALRLRNELAKHNLSNLMSRCILHKVTSKLFEFGIEV